jgi:hypothetical protein
VFGIKMIEGVIPLLLPPSKNVSGEPFSIVRKQCQLLGWGRTSQGVRIKKRRREKVGWLRRPHPVMLISILMIIFFMPIVTTASVAHKLHSHTMPMRTLAQAVSWRPWPKISVRQEDHHGPYFHFSRESLKHADCDI